MNKIKRRVSLSNVIEKSTAEKSIQPIPENQPETNETDKPNACLTRVVRDNSLSAIANAEVDARIVCNALKAFSPLMAASCGDTNRSLEMMDAAEKISVRALELTGLPVDKIPFSLSRILPVTASVVATIEESGYEITPEIISETAKMIATIGGSRQSQKIIQENYVPSGDVIDVRITLMSAMIPVVTEVVLYRFDPDPAKDINACMATVLAAVKKEIPSLVPAQSSEQAAVMIAQSVTRNALHQMAVCWRRQAALCAQAGGIDRSVQDGGEMQASEWRENAFNDFHRVFLATFSAVKRYVSDGTPSKADIHEETKRRHNAIKP